MEYNNFVKNKRFHIDVKSRDALLLSVFDFRLCNKLNKVLNKYPDYSFKKGEEAMYSILQSDFDKIRKYLKLTPYLLEKIENFYKNRVSK